ncbi:DnaT-like ssDNA-binding protein [Tardiphaga sp.]|jgi:hypothetical protein|uniref:DnaT-like ssDNA-binding protein n=1 Tax=Tardiphaga sp. TaxID=1926292 RepID=UPI0037D9FAAE
MQVGVDAYASIAEVSAYLSARGLDTAWDAATQVKQEAAIIEASSFLDASFTWTGRLLDPSQKLGWPRYEAYDGEDRPLEGIPSQVKDACAELANLALGGRLMPMAIASGSTGIKRERIGDVEIEYDNATTAASYGYVQLMLRGLGGMRSTNAGNMKLIRA